MPGMQKHIRNQLGLQPMYDAAAERIVLSSLLTHGADAFYDIEPLVKEVDLYLPENKFIFSAIKKLIVEDNIKKPDIIAVGTLLKSLDDKSFNKYEITEYLGALAQDNIPKENALPFVQTVARFSLVRNLEARLRASIECLHKLTGKEKLSEIISLAEKPLIEFSNKCIGTDETYELGKLIPEYMSVLAKTKPKFRGIPSGFPRLDRAIGGGIRKGGVHLIAGRAKIGKTKCVTNIANNVLDFNIPVLILDTEMTKESTMVHITACMSDVKIDDLENGKYSENKEDVGKLQEAFKRKNLTNLYYHNISGKSHFDWVSIMRRWVTKVVGFNPDGSTKDCLILLDYIKMMDLSDAGGFAEYQYLGQIMIDLQNFALKYDVPIVSMAQLNREGINNDTQAALADSDRLLRYCSSFTIFRKKTEDDFADDPPQNGLYKFVVMDCRYGPGLDQGEYINLHGDFAKAKLIEKRTNIENRLDKNNSLVTKPQSKAVSVPMLDHKKKLPKDYVNVFESTNVPI